MTLSGLRLTGGDSLGEGGAVIVRENLTVQSCIVTDERDDYQFRILWWRRNL